MSAIALGIGLYLAPLGMVVNTDLIRVEQTPPACTDSGCKDRLEFVRNRLWRHCFARHMDPITADRMRLPAAAYLP